MKSESTKKPYETPKLSVYGDIREITQSAVGSMGNDGVTTGPSKTS